MAGVMLCTFWSEVIKCHAASPGSLGTLDLWMSPLQTQLSCWEKSKPQREAMYRFFCQSSTWTQPSSHHSPETRHLSEGASRWSRPQTWGTRSLWNLPHWGPGQVQSREEPSMSCQSSAHIICEHNNMVIDSLLRSNR